MKFKVGERVEVLDEDFSGEVIFVENDLVTIQTEEDFELDFSPAQLVKKDNKKLLNSVLFNSEAINKIHLDNATSQKIKLTRSKRKERSSAAMEIDLHIEKLLSTTKGMKSHEKLNYQLDTVRQQLSFAIRKKIRRVVFIHGVGEGILKLELEYLLKQYDNLTFFDADYNKYGLGATEVNIF